MIGSLKEAQPVGIVQPPPPRRIVYSWTVDTVRWGRFSALFHGSQKEFQPFPLQTYGPAYQLPDIVCGQKVRCPFAQVGIEVAEQRSSRRIAQSVFGTVVPLSDRQQQPRLPDGIIANHHLLSTIATSTGPSFSGIFPEKGNSNPVKSTSLSARLITVRISRPPSWSSRQKTSRLSASSPG